MGVLAKTVHEGGGSVEGILPKFFRGLFREGIQLYVGLLVDANAQS